MWLKIKHHKALSFYLSLSLHYSALALRPKPGTNDSVFSVQMKRKIKIFEVSYPSPPVRHFTTSGHTLSHVHTPNTQ